MISLEWLQEVSQATSLMLLKFCFLVSVQSLDISNPIVFPHFVHIQSLPHTYHTLYDTRLVFPIRETAGHETVGLTWFIIC